MDNDFNLINYTLYTLYNINGYSEAHESLEIEKNNPL